MRKNKHITKEILILYLNSLVQFKKRKSYWNLDIEICSFKIEGKFINIKFRDTDNPYDGHMEVDMDKLKQFLREEKLVDMGI